jgi:hypothetical protein
MLPAKGSHQKVRMGGESTILPDAREGTPDRHIPRDF